MYNLFLNRIHYLHLWLCMVRVYNDEGRNPKPVGKDVRGNITISVECVLSSRS